MHGSLHLIYATEAHRSRHEAAARNRRAASLRRPFGVLRARSAARRAAAHGLPSRAAPGTDSLSLGRPQTASLRGR